MEGCAGKTASGLRWPDALGCAFGRVGEGARPSSAAEPRSPSGRSRPGFGAGGIFGRVWDLGTGPGHLPRGRRRGSRGWVHCKASAGPRLPMVHAGARERGARRSRRHGRRLPPRERLEPTRFGSVEGRARGGSGKAGRVSATGRNRPCRCGPCGDGTQNINGLEHHSARRRRARLTMAWPPRTAAELVFCSGTGCRRRSARTPVWPSDPHKKPPASVGWVKPVRPRRRAWARA